MVGRDRGDDVLVQSERVKMTVVIKSEAAKWKVLTNVLKIEEETSSFNFKPDVGLYIYAVRSDKKSAVQIVMPPGAFEEFTCDEPTEMTFTVEDLAKIVSKTEAKDAFEFNSDSTRGGVKIKVVGQFKSEFDIHTVDPRGLMEKRVVEPSDAVAFYATKDFLSKILERTRVTSDDVSIIALEKSLRFVAKSDRGVGRTQIDVEQTEGLSFEKLTADAASKYNAEDLMSFLKVLPADVKPILVRYGNRFPVTMNVIVDEKGSTLMYFQPPFADVDR